MRKALVVKPDELQAACFISSMNPQLACISKTWQSCWQLIDGGGSLLVIEHNLDVIKCADWVIDMGPEGGSGGGEVVALGTPEEIVKVAASHTGHWLGPVLKAR